MFIKEVTPKWVCDQFLRSNGLDSLCALCAPKMLYNIFLFLLSLSLLPTHLVSSNPTEPLGKRLLSNSVNEIDNLLAGQVNDTSYKSVFSVLNKLQPTATISSIARKLASPHIS